MKAVFWDGIWTQHFFVKIRPLRASLDEDFSKSFEAPECLQMKVNSRICRKSAATFLINLKNELFSPSFPPFSEQQLTFEK